MDSHADSLFGGDDTVMAAVELSDSLLSSSGSWDATNHGVVVPSISSAEALASTSDSYSYSSRVGGVEGVEGVDLVEEVGVSDAKALVGGGEGGGGLRVGWGLQAAFVMLGIGLLYPWNAIVASAGYFGRKHGARNVAFALSTAFTVPNVLSLACMVVFSNKVSVKVRLMVGYGAYVVLVGVLPLLPSLWMVLAVVAVLGALDAVVQGSVFAAAAMTSAALTERVMAGIGAAGFAVISLYVMALATASNSSDVDTVAVEIFFSTSVAVLAVCVGISMYVTRAMASGAGGGGHAVSVLPTRRDMAQVWGAVSRHAVLVFVNFAITLFVFPGVVLSIPSVDERMNEGGSAAIPLSVWLALVFVFCDLVGRSLPGMTRASLPDSLLGTGIVLRLGFIPALVLQSSPRLIRSDTAAIAIVAAFALTNGYLGSLCMIEGPRSLALAQHRELGGIIMVFSLTVGLMVGSTAALVLSLVGVF